MLNEERIILMTQMASYEKGEGKENVKIGNFFRSDYLALQVLKAVISGALVFVIGFGLYMLCYFETFLAELYQIDLVAFAKDTLVRFCIFVGGYAAIVYAVCSWRYAKAKTSLKCYYHNLKKLTSMYNDMQ